MRLFLFLSLLVTSIGFGQRVPNDTISVGKFLLGIQYSTGWTGGDLVNRYGFMNAVGMQAGYKFKSNWSTGVDANFLFGNKVKLPNIFSSLIDSYGNITDVNGDVAAVNVIMRGVHANVFVGKTIPLSASNKNSGLMVQFGSGYLNHRVKIETQTQVVPMLEKEYKRGYDRLTTGINFSQFLGYTHMSHGGFYNFYGGIYALQGLTYNRRTLFFDQPEVPVSKDLRLDLIFGLRFGWYIPFYSSNKDYYIEY
jgi:hypothetical protein